MSYHLKEQICVISEKVLCLGLTLDSNPAIVFEHNIHDPWRSCHVWDHWNGSWEMDIKQIDLGWLACPVS
jgi:hypothetical protein